MVYREDIDGLRAVAVISVILFHSGVEVFAGGYVGVDVFFVISGYLITSLIHKEIKDGSFTFRHFYKRRAARLLPALLITLCAVFTFGLIFYDSSRFDVLGQQIFYSALGLPNFYFAKGVDYFAIDGAYQPLLHLWSLGVEEQFYFLWPLILILIYQNFSRYLIPAATAFLLLSLYWSEYVVKTGQTNSYFLPQYRAFELLIGALVALINRQSLKKLHISDYLSTTLNYLGLLLIACSILFLDKKYGFPGINAVIPCFGTALIIVFPDKSKKNLLSNKTLVSIGLISYPLYLYHLPIVSFLSYFEVNITAWARFSLLLLLTIPFSWATYRYIEVPIRRSVRSAIDQPTGTIHLLAAAIPTFALLGLLVAKTDGFPQRFVYLNPFSFELSEKQSFTYHQYFEEGYAVSPVGHGSALFIGDSLLQQYVYPISKALDININEVDTVTRGGCVLLKGVEFNDLVKVDGISCNDLRERLYALDKTYDYIFISQSWHDSYDDTVLNFDHTLSDFNKWSPFVENTLDHFSAMGSKVILIGEHISLGDMKVMQPSLFMTEQRYKEKIRDVKVSNLDAMTHSNRLFTSLKKWKNVYLVEPYDIFCTEGCTIRDKDWLYFRDEHHLSAHSTDYVQGRLTHIFHNVKN